MEFGRFKIYNAERHIQELKAYFISNFYYGDKINRIKMQIQSIHFLVITVLPYTDKSQ